MTRLASILLVALASLAACGDRGAPPPRDAVARVESRDVPPHYAIITDSLGITPDRIREVRSPTRMRIEVDYVVPPPPPDTSVMRERAMRTGRLLAQHGPPGAPPPERITVRIWSRAKSDAPLRTYEFKGDDLRAISGIPPARKGW
ncbi:MAG: hypothetical protein ABJD07_03765 [Gemmatimonadaceae bacterium]